MRKRAGKKEDITIGDLSINPKFAASEKIRLAEEAKAGGGDEEVARQAAEKATKLAEEAAIKLAKEGGGDDAAAILAAEVAAKLLKEKEAGNPDLDKGTKDALEDVKDKAEFGNEAYFKYLSEKLGRKIESHDDLTQTENPLDSDKPLKELYDWREKTGLPLEDYFKYNEDYDGMEAVKIARKFLQVEYPTLKPEQIDLELNKRFLPSDDDLDENAEAFKAIELEKYATQSRKHFNGLKTKKNTADTGRYPKEIQAKLEFADETIKNYQDSKASTKEFDGSLEKFANATESIKLKISEDLSLDFLIDEAGRKSLPNTMKTMPRWQNADGTDNFKTRVEDGIKLKYFDKILELVYQQGQASNGDGIIKDIKNSTLGDRDDKNSQQDDKGGKKTAGIENKDKLIGSQSRKMSFGRRRHRK